MIILTLIRLYPTVHQRPSAAKKKKSTEHTEKHGKNHHSRSHEEQKKAVIPEMCYRGSMSLPEPAAGRDSQLLDSR